MGGLQVSDRSTLDRLKALDTLPDLHSQLTEAANLCTHGTRAEMVAKWLLEKLKSSPETRTQVETWRSLHSTIRMLPPERLAILLATHSFSTTLKSALEDTNCSGTLLKALADNVEFLLNVAHDPNGASVKAALSLPASDAAILFGIWISHLRERTVTTTSPGSDQDYYTLLHPVLRTLDLRRPASNEADLFSRHCLTPAASLLCVLPAQSRELSHKRRVSGEGSSGPSCRQVLESLLAKHIFRPARTATLQAHAAPTCGGGSRPVGSQHPAFMIQDLLEPLKTTLAKQSARNPEDFNALPQLLDIALRCVSTTTARQRTKEQPWVEAVFHALHGCNRTTTPALASRTALIEMLKVVGARGSLSESTIARIIHDCSNLVIVEQEKAAQALVTHVDWELLVQIIKMDPESFHDRSMAESLFSQLTKASVTLGQHSGAHNSMYVTTLRVDMSPDTLHMMWLEDIVVPVMKAFARGRNLRTFVELWLRQLLQDQHNSMWSVWTELDEQFQLLCEDSFTEREGLELVDRLCTAIKSDLADTNMADAPHSDSKSPSIVVLNAVLGAVYSESLADQLRSRCDELFYGLLQHHDKSDISAESCRFWALLTKTFEAWFPSWAATEPNMAVVAERGNALVSNSAINSALAYAKATRSNNGATLPALRTANDAECFVAGICSNFHSYKESMEDEASGALRKSIDKLVMHLDAKSLEALQRYPHLISFVSSETRVQFFLRCIVAVTSTNNAGQESAAAFDAIRAVVATAVAHTQADVVEDLFKAGIEILRVITEEGDQHTQELSIWGEFITTELFSGLPMRFLSRPQREKILDALCSISIRKHSTGESPQIQFAPLIRLMELPNATSTLATDAAAIWRLSLSVSADEYVDTNRRVFHPTKLAETEALVGELGTLLVKHLVATQDQERSRAMLLELSRNAKDVLEFVCDNHGIIDIEIALALSKAIIYELDAGAKEDLKQQLPYRNAETMTRLFRKMKAAIKAMVSMVGKELLHSPDMWRPGALDIALDILLVASAFLIELPGVDFIGWVVTVIEAIEGRLAAYADPAMDVTRKADLSPFRRSLLRCFQLGCKYYPLSDPLRLVHVASGLLGLQMDPTEMTALLSAFDEYLSRLDVSSKTTVVEELLQVDGAVPKSNLLLLQRCITRLETVDGNVGPTFVLIQLIPKLLLTAADSEDLSARQSATDCIITILKEKSFVINQFGVEQTLTALPRLVDTSLAPSIDFMRACQIFSTFLLFHRARLQGRFHLVNDILQDLISKLFRGTKSAVSQDFAGQQLGEKHARALARILVLFCEPPHTRRQGTKSELVDETRREQAHVCQYVRTVLHHYCTELLNGTLGEGMREALRPGLWAMIEAIEMHSAEGVKSLSAAMNNGERAVLRSVYDDWKRFGKWRGG